MGALTGRRVLHSSDQHRRFQAALLLMLLITPVIAAGLATMWYQRKDSIPKFVRIAGGLDGGVYSSLSTELASRLALHHGTRTEVVVSNGSLDNRSRLLDHQVDLAPMQATAISGEDLCVVAPLFYEVLYVLARDDSNVTSLADLAGHRVAVGPQGSGSRTTAELVFDSLEFDSRSVTRDVIAWKELMIENSSETNRPDVAMICVGRSSPIVTELLESRKWRLVPLVEGVQIALQHPTLRPMTIDAADHPDVGLPPGGIATVGTTAFLAARDNAPSELVTAMLQALYESPEPCVGLIPRRRAAEWQGLAFHRAARKFYAQTATND